MSRTAADQVAEMMIDAGIQRVYGVVGDSINPIIDAARRSDGKLRWAHVRNEEVGAFAAGADALLTGQIAACAGSCGPGNLDLISEPTGHRLFWRRRSLHADGRSADDRLAKIAHQNYCLQQLNSGNGSTGTDGRRLSLLGD